MNYATLIGVADETEIARARSVVRDSRPIPKCHPSRPLGSRGLCVSCYQAELAGPPALPAPLLPPTTSPLPARHRTVGPPTISEIEAFLAVVELGSPAAARALGLSKRTVGNKLHELQRRIGARSRAHAAWLLYPELADRYVLPGDRRLRVAS